MLRHDAHAYARRIAGTQCHGRTDERTYVEAASVCINLNVLNMHEKPTIR